MHRQSETPLEKWFLIIHHGEEEEILPGEDELNTRIINLERDMTDVKVAIGKVETRLENIERNMVTKGQLAVYALLGLMAMVGAGWWVVQQYLAPILAAIGKIPA